MISISKGFLSLTLLALCSFSAFASGFGLYEASAPTYAMGGAVVGRAYDASANFHNPATLTDLTNITVTAGFLTEHPRGRMKTNIPGDHTSTMDPGCFILPHFHLAIPLPYDFAFGLGVMPEYGLGSHYDSNWGMSYNSTETTVQSITINPNIAYKITDDWSIGGGLRFLWFDFEQYSSPIAQFVPGYSITDQPIRFRNRLKGDNGMEDFGYQIGTKYDVFDNFSVGLVYKSMPRVHVKGTSRNESMVNNPTLISAAQSLTGDAQTTLDLPQSITGGFNWDITDRWHLGGAVSWTEWSSVGVLNFHIPTRDGKPKKIDLNWEDTWRFALAPSWDFAENWTAIASYVFETDCCGSQDSTMLPPSTRHMLSAGLVWRAWAGLELGLTYGIILMDGNDSDCTMSSTYYGTNTKVSEKYEYSAHRALSHAAGFTVTYRF